MHTKKKKNYIWQIKREKWNVPLTRSYLIWQRKFNKIEPLLQWCWVRGREPKQRGRGREREKETSLFREMTPIAMAMIPNKRDQSQVLGRAPGALVHLTLVTTRCPSSTHYIKIWWILITNKLFLLLSRSIYRRLGSRPPTKQRKGQYPIWYDCLRMHY